MQLGVVQLYWHSLTYQHRLTDGHAQLQRHGHAKRHGLADGDAQLQWHGHGDWNEPLPRWLAKPARELSVLCRVLV